SLLRHRKWAGHRDFDWSCRPCAQDFNVFDLHRMLTADLPCDTWDWIRMPRAIEGRTGIIDIDALKSSGKSIRVALSPHFAVSNNVKPGLLLAPDRNNRCVVLRLLQMFRRDSPQFRCANTWWETACKGPTVQQPIGLRIRANKCGWQQGQRH